MAPWASILVIYGPLGTRLGTPLGPDLDFNDFLSILGPPWESLWGQFGPSFVICDVKIGDAIRNMFSKRFWKEM